MRKPHRSALILIGFAAWIRFTLWLLPEEQPFQWLVVTFGIMEIVAKVSFVGLGLLIVSIGSPEAREPKWVDKAVIVAAFIIALVILFLPI